MALEGKLRLCLFPLFQQVQHLLVLLKEGHLALVRIRAGEKELLLELEHAPNDPGEEPITCTFRYRYMKTDVPGLLVSRFQRLARLVDASLQRLKIDLPEYAAAGRETSRSRQRPGRQSTLPSTPYRASLSLRRCLPVYRPPVASRRHPPSNRDER